MLQELFEAEPYEEKKITRKQARRLGFTAFVGLATLVAGSAATTWKNFWAAANAEVAPVLTPVSHQDSTYQSFDVHGLVNNSLNYLVEQSHRVIAVSGAFSTLALVGIGVAAWASNKLQETAPQTTWQERPADWAYDTPKHALAQAA